FSEAARHDDSLYDDALARNIVIVTPTTLLATLRTVENIWRYEHQSQNAQLIAKKAGDLYDKLVGFVSDLEELGKRLTTTQKSYDAAVNKLSAGRGNLIRRAEEMKSLGASTSKSLPESLVARAGADVTLLESGR
ncbi:MAG: DNA recombination protein RmuC, partial [Myxococcota bacterium]